MATALDLLLQHGGADVLAAFFAALPARTALLLARVCKSWAAAAELGLHVKCDAHGWKQPRSKRLQRSQAMPWRSLFLSRSCRACFGAAGDFAVRTISSGAPLFFLCGRCAKEGRVVEGLQRLRATLDVTGLSGKPLYTRRESKFCSEISKLSKESMDNASGARADVARHARGGR